MIAPTSVGSMARVAVATMIGPDGAFIVLNVAGSTVYLDAKQTAALLAALCAAELATFVKVSAPL